MRTCVACGEEIAARLKERVDSPEWWVIVGDSMALLEAIEQMYYSGADDKDFELILGPPVGFVADRFHAGYSKRLPLAFAHKRRMSAEQLQELVLIAASVDLPLATLEARDVVAIEVRCDCVRWLHGEHERAGKWRPHPVTRKIVCCACHPFPGSLEFEREWQQMRDREAWHKARDQARRDDPRGV